MGNFSRSVSVISERPQVRRLAEGINMIKKCPVCTINMYPPEDLPSVWPCGVGLFREDNIKKEDRVICPFESREEQVKLMNVADWEKVAGQLGSMHGND
jgi:hypothetical protein